MNGALSSAKDLKRPTVCLGNGYKCFSDILFMTFFLGDGVFSLDSDCCLKMLFGDPDFTWIHIYFDLVEAILASVLTFTIFTFT